MLSQEKILPASSVDEDVEVGCRCWEMGVAVVGLESTAMRRDMYRTVLGDGMGELDVAMRRIWGFGDELDGGVFCQDSLTGERAKLGIRNASMGLDGGGVFCCEPSGTESFLSTVPLVDCEDSRGAFGAT